MVSSQLKQAEVGLDGLNSLGDADFVTTGMKVPSVLRLSCLAVVDGAVLVRASGENSHARLTVKSAFWAVDSAGEAPNFVAL